MTTDPPEPGPKPPGPGEGIEIAHALRLASRGYFCTMTAGFAWYWPTAWRIADIVLAGVAIVFCYLAGLAMILAATSTRNILARTFGLQENPILGRGIGFAILAGLIWLAVLLFRFSGGVFDAF